MSNLRFPPRNLPYESTQWGRYVEEVENRHETEIQALKSSVGNSDRSQSGQLAVLADQIQALARQQADLVGRVSYQRVSGGTIVGTFPPGVHDLPSLGISFTLDSSREVKVTIFNNVSTNDVVFINGVSIDGTRYFRTGRSESTVSGSPVTPMTSAGQYSGLFTLPSGNHTITPSIDVQGLTGPVLVTGYSIVVDILQRVG